MVYFYRLLVILFVIFYCLNAFAAPKGLYVLEYPVNMPDVPLTSENNEKVSLLNTSSDLSIMIFWSKNCAPCLREMKALEKFYKIAASDNISVFLIAPASEWKNTAIERKFLTKFGAPSIPFYNDKKNELSLKLGIGSTPYTVIMDKSGKKIATIQGEADWSSEKLYQMIKKLVK